MANGTLDESPWWTLGPDAVATLIYGGDPPTCVGSMETPALAAQVVAEHRHAVEVRAMLADAERRLAERGPAGQADETVALAARLGFVSAAERDAARASASTALDELNRQSAVLRAAIQERDGFLTKYVTEHENHTSTMHELVELQRRAEQLAAGRETWKAKAEQFEELYYRLSGAPVTSGRPTPSDAKSPDKDRRTPDEWLATDFARWRVLDRDGWLGRDALPWDEPLTRAEFQRRLSRSTVSAPVGEAPGA